MTNKTKVVCPHCTKRDYELIFSETGIRTLDKVKGAKWYPLMKKITENRWTEDWTNGIGIDCKCGLLFFVYNIEDITEPPIVLNHLQNDYSLPWFCKTCETAFLDPKMVCPDCGKAY